MGIYRTALSLVAARDIFLWLFDGKFLFGDDLFDHIPDSDDADQLLIFEDRQMPDVFGGHQGHTFFESIIRTYIEDFRNHQLADRRIFRSLSVCSS